MRNVKTRPHQRRRRNEPVGDGLPEQVHYVDRGCEVSSTCLDCPLPKCKYDDPTWYRAYLREGRDAELAGACHNEGLSVFEVARRYRLSPRTVHRALHHARELAAAS
jgi:hypothetical protein